jgi:CheY-like chemotaxis protein
VKEITVVEDNSNNRLLVRAILDSLNEVTEYESGSSALEGLQSKHPSSWLIAWNWQLFNAVRRAPAGSR